MRRRRIGSAARRALSAERTAAASSEGRKGLRSKGAPPTAASRATELAKPLTKTAERTAHLRALACPWASCGLR